ncbi:DotU family type IV/VI secretion system protein [Citrobacter sp. RHBSTW-00671]|nr:DotU family type IV/VI secretion system protein [Citrobacter sp. RHBSTW-00671]HCJ6373891.1 DotU family type IV/VI secretion system protein [Citrobacter freundii]
MPFFEHLNNMIAQPGATYEELSMALMNMLEDAERKAYECQFAPEEVKEAKFAIVAWIDEVAMTTLWAGADTWRRFPLQRHYFSTTFAGELFYQRLEQLPELFQGAKETYALVLLAGFQGRYIQCSKHEENEFHKKILRTIIKNYENDMSDENSPIFIQPKAFNSNVNLRAHRRLPSLLVLLLIMTPVLILVALYIFLTVA